MFAENGHIGERCGVLSISSGLFGACMISERLNEEG
jgi:hypothetical protein